MLSHDFGPWVDVWAGDDSCFVLLSVKLSVTSRGNVVFCKDILVSMLIQVTIAAKQDI